MSVHYDQDGAKAEKALKLRETHGLTYAVIAERLGVDKKNLPGMLQRAKQRRATAAVNKILERTAETAEKVAG